MLEMYDVTYTDYKWKEKQEKKKAMKIAKNNEELSLNAEAIAANVRKAFLKNSKKEKDEEIPLKDIL